MALSLVDLGKRLLESARLGKTDQVRALMSNGAPFTTDWLGTSPLHMAAQYGHLETAEVLLRAGISKDARTKVDRTALHIAAQEGHTDIVELLIKHGAEVNAIDMLRMTPLHWAVEGCHTTSINLLLTYGANVNIANKFDKTPIDIAEDNGREDILRILQVCSSSPRKGKSKEQKQSTSTTIAKSPLIIQKSQTFVPVNIIKTNSFSAEQLKHIVNRTGKSFESAVSSASSNVTNFVNSSAKVSSSKPVYIRTTAGQSFSSKSTNAKTTVEGESTSQGSTNVLATLAALAEATAPNASISTQEALQWLEAHGITMLPSDNSTIVASALEGGQTVSLTEAGKLALTWVKQQQIENESKEVSTTVQSVQDIPLVNATLSNHAPASNQKVITIVADQTSLPSIISGQQQPFVVLNHQDAKDGDDHSVKKCKTYRSRKDKPDTNGKTFLSTVEGDDERSLLQKELERIKKEAEEYKAKLLVKEHEAEVYRKQLEQLKHNS